MISRAAILLVGFLAATNGQVREGWFDSRVDHFNPRNQETFPMRYYANDEHSYRWGPIFVVVGTDAAVDTRYITQGLFYDIAYLEGAYLFTNEHRYFGQSLPVADASSENMDFLTIDQTLADLAAWIHYLRDTVVDNPRAKIILMGYGHGGALAAYFRQQYPHLCNGAWISSGPVEADLAVPGFMESLGDTIWAAGSSECYNTIFSGFLVAQNLIALGRSDELTELFHLCEPLNTDDRWDTTAFLLGLQTDIQQEMLHLRNLASTRAMCEQIENDTITNSLHALNTWFAREHQFEQCINLNFETYMAPLLQTDFDSTDLQNGLRQRLFLQCTATGFFPTTRSFYQPFGNQIDTEFYVEVCSRAFGDWITEDLIQAQINRMNILYGGKTPKLRNVHYTHGTIDPQMAAGILADLNDDAPATIIPDTFFAPDLESIDADLDSPELRAAKERTRDLIDIWIFEEFEPIASKTPGV
ncbi:putative serine protease K12H4.7 [Wyeomyia smithii]|uniref:putative serine protease K12H4.7 n=1 Tax=Wyeomyia smithii TaxID=174621 RepID=UPI0024681F68|nr:putative serine protease K12H4.7 [Wyeomyia smithii]